LPYPQNLYNSRAFIASIESAGNSAYILLSGYRTFRRYHGYNVITDRDTGQSKGFAFVEMSSDSEAQKAIQELNGTSVDGREIKVNEAKPRTPRSGGGGGGGGGYGGGGGGGRGNRW